MLDVKTQLHYRQCALNMAQATHEVDEKKSADAILETANRYFAFMAGTTVNAETVTMPAPGETLDSIIVAEYSTSDLQALMRVKQFELTVLTNALTSRGTAPA